MMNARRLGPIAIAAFVCASGVALAQPSSSPQTVTPPRQAQGLFGGIRPDPKETTRLDFNVSLIEAYDDDVPTGVQQTVDPFTVQNGGFTTMLDTSASYAWHRKRVDLGANGASTLRHYAELGEVRSIGHSAGFGLVSHMPKRATMFVNQAASYSPTYFYGLIPGDTVIQPGDAQTTSPDYSVTGYESYLYQTMVSIRKDFTARRSVAATGEYSYTDRLRESDRWRDVSSYTLRGEYFDRLGRNVAFTTRMHYRSGTYGYASDGTTTEVAVSGGVDYSRLMSATRRLTLQLNVGAARSDLPESTTNVVGFERAYTGTVQGTAIYQFRRTWQARVDVRRGIEYLGELPTPVYANGFKGGVDGLLSRRLDLSASAGYSSGTSILNRDALVFDTYTGDMKLRYAVNRTLAVYVDYLYYYYLFSGFSPLLPGIPPGLERNGARAGLTLWVPAFRR